jgi:hypothetical protein
VALRRIELSQTPARACREPRCELRRYCSAHARHFYLLKHQSAMASHVFSQHQKVLLILRRSSHCCCRSVTARLCFFAGPSLSHPEASICTSIYHIFSFYFSFSPAKALTLFSFTWAFMFPPTSCLSREWGILKLKYWYPSSSDFSL